MVKFERYIVYPLLVLALLRAFVSAPVLMAQGAVQERIVCRELTVVNQGGVEVVRVRIDRDGNGIVLVCDQRGEIVREYGHQPDGQPKRDLAAPRISSDGTFMFSGASVLPMTFGCKLAGDVTNRSGRDYVMAWFTATAYGRDGSELGKSSFAVWYLRNGDTKPFGCALYSVSPGDVCDYRGEVRRLSCAASMTA